MAIKYEVKESIVCDFCEKKTTDKCDKCGKDCCYHCQTFIGRTVENWCPDCIKEKFGREPNATDEFVLAFL